MLNFIPETFASTTADLQLKMMAVGLFWMGLGVYAFFRIVTIRCWTPSADAVSSGRGRSKEVLGLRGEPHLASSEENFVTTWLRRSTAIIYIFTLGLISRSGRPGREILESLEGGYFYVEDESTFEKALRLTDQISDVLRFSAEKIESWFSYRVYIVNRFISYKWRQIHWTYKHL